MANLLMYDWMNRAWVRSCLNWLNVIKDVRRIDSRYVFFFFFFFCYILVRRFKKWCWWIWTRSRAGTWRSPCRCSIAIETTQSWRWRTTACWTATESKTPCSTSWREPNRERWSCTAATATVVCAIQLERRLKKMATQKKQKKKRKKRNWN